jgi:uncharacterized protein (TIGR04255 family)
MRNSLPQFRRPPVNEVILSSQFEPLLLMRAVHIGAFWEKLRTRYPRTEEHPPLDPAIEVFGTPRLVRPEVRLELVDQIKVPRIWMLDLSGAHLLQVQTDRLIQNWRQVDGVGDYPRYPSVRAQFEESYSAFEQFATAESLGEIAFNQCEVTYINHILPCSVWENHSQIGEVFAFWNPGYSEVPLPLQEAAFVTTRTVLRNESGGTFGRLHLSIQSVYRLPDAVPMFVLSLAVRGAPVGHGLPGVFAFFDRAREWIVRTFATVTTSKMHEVWERYA